MRSAARLVLVALACAAMPASLLAAPIGCSGPFGPDASHEGLIKAFGETNVGFEDKLDGAEGEKVAASVVFPDDPERRLEVVWLDTEKRSRIANVTLGLGSTWVFGPGLTVGQSLAALENANGRPFDLNGFGWDYGGAVVDWKGGILGTQPGGCTLGVFLSPKDDAPSSAIDAVSGDQLFSSSDPKIKAVTPSVAQIYFGYPEKP
jgi:hypothetical protein